MTTTETLYKKIKKGFKPTVRFTECVPDSDSQYEVGMMGTIVSATLDSNGIVEFVISEKGFEKYNVKQEQPVWYKNINSEELVCKSEVDGRTISDCVSEDIDDNFCNFEIVEDSRLALYAQYMESNVDIDYTRWLENTLLKKIETDEHIIQSEKPYKKGEYNPNYGDHKYCVCGHTYERHFDSYDNMEPVGCKYCNCSQFVENEFQIGVKIEFRQDGMIPLLHGKIISMKYNDIEVRCKNGIHRYPKKKNIIRICL